MRPDGVPPWQRGLLGALGVLVALALTWSVLPPDHSPWLAAAVAGTLALVLIVGGGAVLRRIARRDRR